MHSSKGHPEVERLIVHWPHAFPGEVLQPAINGNGHDDSKNCPDQEQIISDETCSRPHPCPPKERDDDYPRNQMIAKGSHIQVEVSWEYWFNHKQLKRRSQASPPSPFLVSTRQQSQNGQKRASMREI